MKFVLIALVCVVSATLIWVVNSGIKPKPVLLISPTVVEKGDQVGGLLSKRLWSRLDQVQAVILKDSKLVKESHLIWEGFLKTSSHQNFDTQLLVVDQGASLKLPIPLMEVSGSANIQGQILTLLKDLIEQNRKFAVWTKAPELKGSLPESFVSKLQALPKLKSLSISLVPFVVRREQEDSLLSLCAEEDNLTGIKRSCAALNFSRRYYRKKLKLDLIQMGLEQHSSNDYLLYMYVPKLREP